MRTFAIASVGYVLGLIYACFVLVQVILIIKVGFGITKTAEENGLNCRYKDLRRLLRTQLFTAILLSALVAFLAVWLPPREFTYPFFVAIIFGLVLGRKQYGLNNNNVSDYIKNYSRFYMADLYNFLYDENGNLIKRERAKKRSRVPVIILSILSVLLAAWLGATIYAAGTTIYELKAEVAKLTDTNKKLTTEITTAKKEKADAEKQLDYIWDLESNSCISRFYSIRHIIVLEVGDEIETTIICETPGAVVYMDVDNTNIFSSWTGANGSDYVVCSVKGLMKGFSTITFSNSSNHLTDSILVIVK